MLLIFRLLRRKLHLLPSFWQVERRLAESHEFFEEAPEEHRAATGMPLEGYMRERSSVNCQKFGKVWFTINCANLPVEIGDLPLSLLPIGVIGMSFEMGHHQTLPYKFLQ
jgi:hypothetical protein